MACAVFSTALDTEIPELRIVSQEIWDAAQTQMEKNEIKVAEAGNARTVHRALYLLSGLMVCACCGAPYVICGKDSNGCRDHRDGACGNGKTIRHQCIESRIFNRLRLNLLTPDLTGVFNAAIRAERNKMQGSDAARTLKGLQHRQQELENKRKNIFLA